MTGANPPWQRILLATEHTEFDVGAERLAIALGQRSPKPLVVVVPVVSNAELVAEAPGLAARVDAEAAKRRSELLNVAAAAGIRVDVRARTDAEAWRAIVDCAHETSADLVVIRRRGRRGFVARLMVGEMAGSVASTAPCDVLMVPRAGAPWKRAVLVAVDTSATAMHVTSAAAHVAKAFALPLRVVCVAIDRSDAAVARAEESLRQAIEALARDGISAEGAVRFGKAHEEIVAAAADCAADVVVVGRRGTSGALHRRSLGSTAQRVVALANCPVLVVRT